MTTIITRATVNQEQSERLMKARCRLMMREPWYGHIAMSMVWIPSQMDWMPENRRTMGVRIVNGGEIQCLYYPPFVDSLNIKELFAVIQHEIEHIVRVHCVRAGDRQHQAWNIACDMTINGLKSKPRIGYPDPQTNELVIPFKNEIIWIPTDWPEDGTAEQYYDRLQKNQKSKTCNACGRPMAGKSGTGGSGKNDKKGQKGDEGEGDENEGNGQGQGQCSHQPGQGHSHGQGQPCPNCGQDLNGDYDFGGVKGRSLDDHSTWNQSDVSQDEARQVIKDIVDQATAKAQGNIPSHLQSAVKALAKPVVRWRELLRHYLGKHVGNHRTTFSRRHRRRDCFGIPGISHHAAAKVVVVVDTSGSIGQKELEQFFAEIEAISSRAKIKVLMWDAAFQGFGPYRRGDWKTYQVKGRGGTDMAAPVQWLIDNKQVADVQIMLTDGYCNYLDAKLVKFPFITVITTGEDVSKGPDYGHAVRMKL